MKTAATILTPPGKGGIAIILLNGPDAESILTKIFRPHRPQRTNDPNTLHLGHIVDGDEIVDEVLVRYAPGRAEINIHGGPVIARRILQILAGCCVEVLPADTAPVNFPTSHPKWNNPAIGKEMLRAINLAESKLALRALSEQWSSGLSRLVRETIDKLSPAKNRTVDIPDRIADELRQASQNLVKMNRLLHPAEIVIAGPPNAGKSTLMNELAARSVSIVHDTPGTTRDWVRESSVINGAPVHLTDTAGIWNAPNEIDAIAIERARQKIQQAELVILLATKPDDEIIPTWMHAANTIRVHSKADLHPTDAALLAISVKTGEGIEELKSEIVRKIGLGNFNPNEPSAFTDRQSQLLNIAADKLETNKPAQAQENLINLIEND